MVHESKGRKRISALRRAPDGSAFQFCEKCGVSVAVALVDMHECDSKNIKKLKGDSQLEQRFRDQPRSEFRFFMESFALNCNMDDLLEIDRKGFETWKNMSSEEKLKYKLQAKKVNNAYYQQLMEEEDQMVSRTDEDGDSAKVRKFEVVLLLGGGN
ncbi:uncharacterized protein [Rutidosis leptorrhynchoides]|uniref:uncharacterized protein n=1 Tax=Rutidosis leptorrhynchoides TaxID=125765 RepID=UPI003A99DB18